MIRLGVQSAPHPGVSWKIICVSCFVRTPYVVVCVVLRFGDTADTCDRWMTQNENSTRSKTCQMLSQKKNTYKNKEEENWNNKNCMACRSIEVGKIQQIVYQRDLFNQIFISMHPSIHTCIQTPPCQMTVGPTKYAMVGEAGRLRKQRRIREKMPNTWVSCCTFAVAWSTAQVCNWISAHLTRYLGARKC